MEDAKETGRVEAFSDGVFAVAITLLVLNIQIPPEVLKDPNLLQFLLSKWAVYLAFVASFATVGIMWINHHRLFTQIKRVNTTLFVLNLLLLFIIVFVPFPTALLAQSLVLLNQHVAALLYSGTFVLLAIVFNLLWHYAAYHHRLLDTKANPDEVRSITRQYMFGPLFYLIAFGLAWFSTPASIIFNLLLAGYFALPGRPSRSQAGNKEDKSKRGE